MTKEITETGNITKHLIFRHSKKAKRVSLRIDPIIQKGVLILPMDASVQEGLALAKKHENWLRKQVNNLPPLMSFSEGNFIPFKGKRMIIKHGGNTRGLVKIRGNQLLVFGRIEHLQRRLTDWLKSQARSEITQLVTDKSSMIGLKPGRIFIRDQKSRWGSCAYNGNLSFNWRLIMAPNFVLEYVVSHEVAHLLEHNHSCAFWDIVESITDYKKQGRDWLKREGLQLHRYGRLN